MIQPGQIFNLKLSFEPKQEILFSSTFELVNDSTQLRFHLIGEGVVPKIQVLPAEKHLYLGDIQLGESSSAEFEIKNQSAFPITCNCHFPFELLPLDGPL